MDGNKEKAKGQERLRYIWDPDKRAWVESVEKEPKPVPERIEEEREEDGTSMAEVTDETISTEAEWQGEVLIYKGAMIRLVGVIIDLVVLFIASVIIGYVIRQFTEAPIPVWIVIIYGLLYFVGFWSWRGQTPGKMLIGAKIVKMDGSSIDPGRALLRFLFYLIPFFGPVVYLTAYVHGVFTFILPLIAIIIVGVTASKRGIHDFIAGTCVIDLRAEIPRPMVIEETDTEQQDEDNPETTD